MRAFARVSGKAAGSGKCLWADEFALEQVAAEAKAVRARGGSAGTTTVSSNRSQGERSGSRRRLLRSGLRSGAVMGCALRRQKDRKTAKH